MNACNVDRDEWTNAIHILRFIDYTPKLLMSYH